MSYTQDERFIRVSTPLGKDALLLRSFVGAEAVSRPFAFELELLDPEDAVDFRKLLGKQATVELELAGSRRFFNGYINRLALTGRDKNFVRYRAELVPWLWLLTRHADCRIFQNKSIPDILKQVFSDRGFASKAKFSLQGSYPEREYCVQYRETDFNFVSRLMEESGIFYYFEHSENDHTLVAADSREVHKPCPGQSSAYFGRHPDVDDFDAIEAWETSRELQTGKCSLTDYNFESPATSLVVAEPTVIHADATSNQELFDFPGGYTVKSQGESLAKVRMQEQEAEFLVATGSGNCRGFASGYRFDLHDGYAKEMNGSYILTEVRHQATVGDSYYTSAGNGGESRYANSFTCIPHDVPFRPRRTAPRPFVQGPQTAVVVSQSGEEMLVDKYGRVKVQFFWDRQGKRDERSSCWIRVSQPWAGKNYGGVFTPRAEQEVIVSFLEGDPDRPIITGRVYNADQMPPTSLPNEQTKSGWVTRSTTHGGNDNANLLIFDDDKGKELIHLHAEKDMTTEVEHDDKLDVGHDQVIAVANDRTETVKQGNDKVTIQSGNAELLLEQGNRTVTLNMGKSTTSAMQSIEMKVGENSIKIDQSGITLQGLNVKIAGQVNTELKGLMTTVNGEAMLTAKGGITMIN